MALLALTRPNVDFLKQHLRAIHPTMKSSHLSEAIAAAFGFRTNIAMVASLRKQDVGRPDLAEFDEGLFRSRLQKFGVPSTNTTAPDNLIRSPDLPNRIWAACKHKDISSKNLWFHECQRLDIPYITMSTRRTLAQVNWDCISLHTRHDSVTRSVKSTLVHRMVQAFQTIARGKSGKPTFDGSSFVGNIENVPMKMAPHLADATFQILYDAIRDNEREMT